MELVAVVTVYFWTPGIVAQGEERYQAGAYWEYGAKPL
jgi:hypothetical protein